MYMYRLYIDILYILLINLFIYMYLYVYIYNICVCACVIINPVNHFEHGNANVGSWLFG